MVLVILTFLFFSCGEPEGGGSYNNTGNLPASPFWALNCRNNSFYRVYASLRHSGSHCEIWVEKGNNVSDSMAKDIANEFDLYIYNQMIDTFSIKNENGFVYNYDTNEMVSYDGTNGEVIGHNIMDLGYWMTGKNNKKLIILILDIQDSYTTSNGSYVAGYFLANNFFDNQYSNAQNIIYIDSYPGTPGSPASNTTLAHEMQHLMNFVTSYWFRHENVVYHPMDLWIDEGLSAAAEWVYGNASPEITDEHPADRWKWFNEDTKYFKGVKGLISSRGNNFFVWGNHEKDDPNAILDDYSTVYLFFQWLRLQAEYHGYNYIFRDIMNYGISDTEIINDYKAVTGAASERISGYGFNDWGTLLKTWMAANYINAPGGIYGYMNDPTLKKIKANTVYNGTKNISLVSGEGVYSTINAGVNPSSSKFINYAGLSDTLNESGPFTGGVLLTCNVDTNKVYYSDGTENGTARTGEITGNPSANFVPDQLNRQISGSYGPYSVSAADMLRQNGSNEKFSGPLAVTKLKERMVRE